MNLGLPQRAKSLRVKRNCNRTQTRSAENHVLSSVHVSQKLKFWNFFLDNTHQADTITEHAHKSLYTKNSVPLIPEGKKPILLWWTQDLFPHDRSQSNHEITCKKGTCITSIDRGLKNDPATRAFIFYGTDLRADDLPLPRRPWDEWALFHEESPKNNWMLTFEDALV